MAEAQTAQGRYDELAVDREEFLYLANECAKYTIPSLFQYPKPGKVRNIVTPYQSVGSRGVNNLASKLMLSLLPPNTPCFRNVLDKVKIEQHQPDPALISDLEKALSKFERQVMSEIESSGDRTVCHEGFRHLVVVGNILLYDGETGMKAFHLDSYVCKRDPEGNPLEIIAKESIAPAALPTEFLAKITAKKELGKDKKKSAQTTLDIYTQLIRKDDEWEIHQECEGEVIEGTYGSYPLDACPWMPLRFIRKDGKDYGYPYVGEYLGDLISLDGFSEALLEGSLAAAKVLIMVSPNGQTSLKAVAKAKNMAVIAGKAEDVTTMQLQKFNDFRVAQQQSQAIEERLAYAFLLNTAVQRNAERVTAEEIRYVAGELESALGGVYSLMTTEMLLPYIKQKIAKMERHGKLPPLPKDIVKPTIVVGVEALGRGTDRAKLVGYLTTLTQALGPEAVKQYINVSEACKRLATADGIDTEGLIKSQEEIDASAQQQVQQAMLHRLGPNAVNQIGSAMTKGIAPGMPGGPPMDVQAVPQETQQPQEG